MTIIEVGYETPRTARRLPEEVLGLEVSSASRRGSTFWSRTLACPREHLLSNELGWARSYRGDALDYGLVWHYCLEAYYRGLQAEQEKRPQDDAPDTAAFRLLEAFADEPGWRDGYETISRMLKKYFEDFDKRDRRHWEIVDVECTLEVPLSAGYGFEYSTRLDLFIKDHSIGDPVCRHVEHKSASALDQNTISGHQQGLQVLGQIWLAEKLVDYEEPYLGAIVNICTKAKEPKTARVPVQPGPALLDAWEESMRFWARYAQVLPAQGYPRNFASCVRRYGRCQFFDLCGSAPGVETTQLVEITTKARAGEGSLLPGYRFANDNDEEA